MGQLVFQATLGGQVNLVGPNTASTFNINVPAVAGNMVTTGDTGTVTSTMLASSVYTAPGTIGSGTPNTGAFTTLSASSTVTLSGGTANGVAYLNGSKVLTTGSALVFDGTNLGLGVTPSAWANFTNVLQNQGGAIASSGVNNIRVFQNSYYNGTNYIYKTTEAASRYDQQQGIHAWFTAPSGTAGNPISFTQAMTLDSSGNLLVGTTSAGTDKVRFASAGNSTNQLGLVSTDDASGNGYIQFRNAAGTSIGSVSRISTTNAVAYNTTSDHRLKTVVGAVTGQGERIDALNPIDYQWKDGGSNARGFLAHEFQEVYANSVNGAKDAVDADGNPIYQAMQPSTPEVMADLIAEIQSLRQRLAAAGI